MFLILYHTLQLAGAVEYTDCISAAGYDTKQSDGEVPVMLELWGMQSTSSLPLLPGPFWPGVIAPDIYGLNRTRPWFREFTVLTFKLHTYDKLNRLK